MIKTTTVNLTNEQINFVEDLKWKHRVSKSKIYRVIVDYFIKNPEELEELLKNDKKKKE